MRYKGTLVLLGQTILLLPSLCFVTVQRLPHTPFFIAASPIVRMQPTPLSNPQTLPGGPDYTILIAVIGAIGAILAAIIAGFFAIYQTHLKATLQKKMEVERHDHAQELVLLQQEIDGQGSTNDAGHLRQERYARSTRMTMLQAQNLFERFATYKAALHTDPNIAWLKILDMPSPMNVTSVYVRLRLHREARASFVLEPVLSETEDNRDPNELLQASQLYLESRFHTALEPDEAIRQYKRCIILGDPGAGKTTLLKNLVLRSVDAQLKGLPDFPIHLELHTFATSGYSNLVEFAAAKWNERYGFPQAEARMLIVKHLKAGTALLLLDALDETVIGDNASTAENCYRRVSDAIMQIATRYHQTPIVVTARKAGYQQRATLSGFTELVVLDFRPQDIRQFVTNWFACHQDPQRRRNAPELVSKLERSPRIQALAANPLLLSLIVILYEARLDLPDRRAELYKQCVDTLMTTWDASRNIRRRREFKPEHKHLLLDEVAWYFHNRGQRYFREEELLHVIADFLPAIGLPVDQSQRVLEEIANENGLLKEQARGWHGFLHLTLQEYFVAQRVTDRNQLGILLAHWGEPWWEEVILLFAGHTADASLLLKMLIGQDAQHPLQRDLFYSNVILAGRCLAARPVVRQLSLRDKVINLLMDILLNTPFSLTREQIADVLVEIGGKDINARLIDVLTEQKANPTLGIAIISAFGRLGDRFLAPDLFALLDNSFTHFNVRLAIAYVIGKLGDPTITPLLLEMLANPQKHLHLKEKIALSLGDQEDTTILQPLLQLLSDPQLAPSLRGAIALALGKRGDRSVVKTLLTLMDDDHLAIEIRCNIVEALGLLEDQSVVMHLLEVLAKAKSSPLRQAAALALGKIGDHAVMSVGFALLAATPHETEVLLSIVHTMSLVGDGRDVPKLLQLLSYEKLDLRVRHALIDAMANIGDRSISQHLLHLVTGKHVPLALRLHIIDALAIVGHRSIMPALAHMLTDASLDMETSIYINCTFMKLNKNGGAAQVLRLFQLLMSKDTIQETLQTHGHIVFHILDTFSHAGDGSIVPCLLPLISEKHIHRTMRLKFVHSIGQLANNGTAITRLVAELQHSDIADAIHRALWSISRRIGIVIPYGPKAESHGKLPNNSSLKP